MTLFVSGFKNWKTTLAGLIIAVLTVYLNGGFKGLSNNELLAAIGAAVFGFLVRDANKSSQDSSIRPKTLTDTLIENAAKRPQRFDGWLILPFLLALLLPSCATRTDGTKTFAGMDARGALYLAGDVTSAYLRHTHPRTLAKLPVDVTAEPQAEPGTVAAEMPWYLRLMGLMQ